MDNMQDGELLPLEVGPMASLPDEVLIRIFQHVGVTWARLRNLALVCPRWARIVNDRHVLRGLDVSRMPEFQRLAAFSKDGKDPKDGERSNVMRAINLRARRAIHARRQELVSLVIPTTTRHFPEKRGEETALLMAIFETPPPAPTPREPGDDPSENPAKKPTYHKPKKGDVNEVVIGGKLYKLSASMCFPCLTSLWIDSKGMSAKNIVVYQDQLRVASLIARYCPKLQRLSLNRFTALKAETVAELVRGCPHLTHLLLRDCSVTPPKGVELDCLLEYMSVASMNYAAASKLSKDWIPSLKALYLQPRQWTRGKLLQLPSPSVSPELSSTQKFCDVIAASDVSKHMRIVYEGLFPCIMNNDVAGLSLLVKELGVSFKKMVHKSKRKSPLIVAASKGKIEMVKALIKLGADPTVIKNKAKPYHSTIAAAVASDSFELVSLLVTRYRVAPDPHALVAAIAKPVLLEYLLVHSKEGYPTEIDAANPALIPLHRIVKNVDIEDAVAVQSIKILVKYGADVNARDSEHKTPLWVAAERGQLELVKVLYQLGGDPSRKHLRVNAYRIAVRHGHSAVAAFLEGVRPELRQKSK